MQLKAKSLLPETDTVFDEFVEEFVQQCIREEEHHKSIWSQGTFNQPWKSTSKFLFPIIPMVPRGMPDLQRRWTTMKDGPHVQQYARYLCIETNILEQTFMLDTQSITQLIRVGYVDQDAAFADDSKLQDKYLITSILRDTHQALDMIWEVANDTEKLTTDFLVKLHGTCLKNSCILPLKAREDGDTQELKYTNVGVTREECRKNVVLPGPPRVQFAPLERVVDEMNRICHLARQWLKNWTRNPFATSAWLHLVFVSCHPFEDGNGRVARLLASIPLIKAGLPPLCIPAIARKSYYDGINKARGGNYELLISCFVRALEASISAIEDLENDPSAMTVI
ncbi:hypothetical protein PLICRDRAFT_51960 [Plicaturopsis crispa FD-325 SS-3]|nr:hypothetical protein PLICRDRAFT_51960 [Plicaturopsis crispa FD-325 SS-3]